MTDDKSLARILEAERIIHEAIADVPLTCSGPEIAAAVQGLGLKLAEKCMEPRVIAHVLMSQAEGYMKAAGIIGKEPQSPVGEAHAILSGAIEALKGKGLSQGEAGDMMLQFVAGWLAKTDRTAAAAIFYQMADAFAVPRQAQH